MLLYLAILYRRYRHGSLCFQQLARFSGPTIEVAFFFRLIGASGQKRPIFFAPGTYMCRMII